MRLFRLLALTAVCACVATHDGSAQLRPTRAGQQRVNNNPRLLVATPHVNNNADSAAAVRIGNGIRERLSGQADRWFNVVTRDQMNEALEQYAYPVDAVLPLPVARTLGTALQARALVLTTLTRNPAGGFSAVARLTGINDDAGHLVTVSQQANQSFESFGQQVANALLPAFRALPDAKSCMDQSIGAPDKAIADAEKALKQVPDHGLASYCLGEIALAKKNQPEAIEKFQAATRGDSLSLKAWNQLGVLYQLTGDSAKTITTFQQMLRVAPTNQALREEAFRLFLSYGRPDAAEQVADEGLAIDPNNADLWDLKSNSCLARENYPCAIDALEQAYSNDSTKADTLFFQKITFAASREPDTTRFLKWSRIGSRKFPNDPFMMEQLIQAYGYAGPLDSVVAVTRRLVAANTSDMTPVIRAIQALGAAGRIDDMMDLGSYIDRYGNGDDKQNFASLLLGAGQPMLQDPTKHEKLREITARVVSLVPEGSQVYRQGSFFLGAASWLILVELDKTVDANRSCEQATRMQQLLNEIGPAITAGRAVAEDFSTSVLQGVEAYRTRVTSLNRAYCT